MHIVVPAHRLSTASLLPTRLREEYGMRWTALHELALPIAARSVRLAATPVLASASRFSAPLERLAA